MIALQNKSYIGTIITLTGEILHIYTGKFITDSAIIVSESAIEQDNYTILSAELLVKFIYELEFALMIDVVRWVVCEEYELLLDLRDQVPLYERSISSRKSLSNSKKDTSVFQKLLKKFKKPTESKQ